MFCAVCTTELTGPRKYCYRNIALPALRLLYNCWEFVGPGHKEAGNGYFSMDLVYGLLVGQQRGRYSLYLVQGWTAELVPPHYMTLRYSPYWEMVKVPRPLCNPHFLSILLSFISQWIKLVLVISSYYFVGASLNKWWSSGIDLSFSQQFPCLFFDLQVCWYSRLVMAILILRFVPHIFQ